MKRHLIATIVLLALSAPRLLAAGYSGQVTFGALPVPGATVTASKGDRHVTTVTDENGAFTFRDLDDGAWTVRVEMLAFATLTRDVMIRAGTPPAVWPLTIKSLDEMAIAAGAASDASIGPPVASARSRPAPSVSDTAAPVPALPANTPVATMASNEREPDAAADGYLINGSVNNGAASPIAQSPAFGNNRRQAGSLFNGGLAVVYGGSALDSRPFSFANVPASSPDYQNLKVNGTFGGPLKIAKDPRHRPMVFLSFQHAGDHSATTQPGVMPTVAERSGDFSESRTADGRPIQIIDPLTGAPFERNVIPASRLSPQALALFELYPLPSSNAVDGFNFQSPLVTSTTQNLLTTRVTQLLRSKSQLVGLVAYQHATTDETTLFGFTDASKTSGADASLTWMERISPSLSVRVRYQFVRLTNGSTSYFANRLNVSGEAGIAGNNQDPVNWGPPALQFSSITGLTDALPAFTRNDTHGTSVEAYWTHGHHNVTFGGDLRRITTAVQSQLNPRGAFSFSGAATGSDLADFLLGIPSTSTIASGNADKAFRALSSDGYVTDDWRFSPTLTMQVGARWEVATPPTERFDRLVNLDIAPGFTAVSPVLAGGVGSLTGRAYSRGLLRTDWSGLQPRLGVAWRPIPGSSLIVRGGYGIYRNNGIYQPIALLLAQQPPLSNAFTISNSPAHPLSLANGFTAPPGSTSNIFAVDPDLRVGASHNWQALVQRDLWGFVTLTASYLGTYGQHLLQEFLPNTYPAGAANPCASCPSGFVYVTSGGRSFRHAGQWQARWRLHRGLAASVQYTLSNARDNATAFAGVSMSGSAIAQNWLDLDAEDARSNFDQRHQMIAQLQYTTGVGLGGGGLMDGLKGQLLRGWTLTGQLTTGSGLPFTPVYLGAVSGTGVVGALRPSLTGASLDPPAGRYLNPDAYTLPSPGEWGSAGRNSVTGPASFNFDFGIARGFQWTRRLTFDWRIDATNVLNRRTYIGVNSVLGGPQFGLPNLANTPRRLLSTMRLRF